ncbi:MAG: hypothetical protein JSV10_00915, partial [Candidatus Zixiibacteriota bacterium]
MLRERPDFYCTPPQFLLCLTIMDWQQNENARIKRRDSLRLRHFDYAAPRAYFITVCVTDGRTVFSDKKVAERTL